jgi:hypothetical protein
VDLEMVNRVRTMVKPRWYPVDSGGRLQVNLHAPYTPYITHNTQHTIHNTTYTTHHTLIHSYTHALMHSCTHTLHS